MKYTFFSFALLFVFLIGLTTTAQTYRKKNRDNATLPKAEAASNAAEPEAYVNDFLVSVSDKLQTHNNTRGFFVTIQLDEQTQNYGRKMLLEPLIRSNGHIDKITYYETVKDKKAHKSDEPAEIVSGNETVRMFVPSFVLPKGDMQFGSRLRYADIESDSSVSVFSKVPVNVAPIEQFNAAINHIQPYQGQENLYGHYFDVRFEIPKVDYEVLPLQLHFNIKLDGKVLTDTTVNAKDLPMHNKDHKMPMFVAYSGVDVTSNNHKFTVHIDPVMESYSNSFSPFEEQFTLTRPARMVKVKLEDMLWKTDKQLSDVSYAIEYGSKTYKGDDVEAEKVKHKSNNSGSKLSWSEGPTLWVYPDDSFEWVLYEGGKEVDRLMVKWYTLAKGKKETVEEGGHNVRLSAEVIEGPDQTVPRMSNIMVSGR